MIVCMYIYNTHTAARSSLGLSYLIKAHDAYKGESFCMFFEIWEFPKNGATYRLQHSRILIIETA